MKKILIMMLVLMTAFTAGCIAGGKDADYDEEFYRPDGKGLLQRRDFPSRD